MKYLLDTDVVINHLRGKKLITKSFITRGASISIISYGELMCGLYKKGATDKQITQVFETLHGLDILILSLNQEIFKLYAMIRVEFENTGKKLDDFDLLIAATAQHHALTLITGNIKHFQRIPKLKLKNVS